MVKWACRITVLSVLVLLPSYAFCIEDDFGFESLDHMQAPAHEVPEAQHAPEQAEVKKEEEHVEAPHEQQAASSAQPNAHEVPEHTNENSAHEQVPQEQPTEAAHEAEAAPQAKPAVQKPAEPAVTPVEPKKEANAPEDVDVKGIDTVNLKEPQGNWLFKRIWWERAEEKYEKARALAEQVFELRMTFITQRSDLDKNVFDPFYLAIGLSQGELKTVIADLLEKIEKTRATLGSLTPEQRELSEKLMLQKSALEQISLDVTAVNMVDQEIEKYFIILFEQMNRVRGYEKDAWHFFKEISRELSDKKAREIYFKMDTILKNIASIQNYLVKDFTPSFSKQVEIARSQVERLKTVIQELKDKDFDLKVQFEKMVADQAKQQGVQPVVEPEEDEEQEPQGFFSYYIVSPVMAVVGAVGSALKAVWDGVVYIIWWPIEKIMGTTHHEQENEESEPVTQPAMHEPVTSQEVAPQQQSGGQHTEAEAPHTQSEERPVEHHEMAQPEHQSEQPAAQPQQPVAMPEGATGEHLQKKQEVVNEHTAQPEGVLEQNSSQEHAVQAAPEHEGAAQVAQ